MFIFLLLISSLTPKPSSAPYPSAFRLITAPSSSTLLPLPCCPAKVSCCKCHAPILPHKWQSRTDASHPQQYSASHAHCSSPGYWAEALATTTYVLNHRPSSLFRSSIIRFLIILISRFLGVYATQTLVPRLPINFLHALLHACSSVTPPLTKAIATWIYLHAASMSLVTLCSMRLSFHLRLFNSPIGS
jgi:hypothetical protein